MVSLRVELEPGEAKLAQSRSLMLEDPRTTPNGSGVLAIDETGDRKDGKATAHVGKQYLLGGASAR